MSMSMRMVVIVCVVLSRSVLAELAEAEVYNTGNFPLDLKDIVFIVLSQPNEYHVQRAQLFKEEFNMQLEKFKNASPIVLLLHERWPTQSAWTIFPILQDIAQEYGEQQKWVMFCDAETRFHLNDLADHLAAFDYTKMHFVGRPLQDRSPVIIHHFEFEIEHFQFPDFSAGLAMSIPLINKLAKLLQTTELRSDFTIDIKHELALFIYKHLDGLRLTPATFLCTLTTADDGTTCASSISQSFPECGEPISEDDLHVAVKTCKAFHESRVTVVKNTWAKQAKHVAYYSDTEDSSIPTVDLGIANTERGHCAKMYGILERFSTAQSLSKMKWLIIVDDDTLLSVPRLRRLLQCYNADQRVVLGERYGYGLAKQHGYNYPTGGAGMVFSRPAAEAIIQSPACTCRSPESPDDMMLGSWLKYLDLPVTNSPLLHQARPDDYAVEYLSSQVPVSFHKHWNCDPYEVYQKWLHTPQLHVEL